MSVSANFYSTKGMHNLAISGWLSTILPTTVDVKLPLRNQEQKKELRSKRRKSGAKERNQEKKKSGAKERN